MRIKGQMTTSNNLYVIDSVDGSRVGVVRVVTSGARSGWNRGRIPAWVGRCLASGECYGAYIEIKDYRRRTAVRRGNRWYTRLVR